MTRDAKDYHIGVHADPLALDAGAWNRLLSAQAQVTPFMRHEYLAALHASGSAVPATGWAPCFITLQDDAGLAAAAALYLKSHSYGEYVFDWAWADAYRRHGQRYYPKLLVAVPFTPVPGTRLLARDAAARQALVRVVDSMLQERQASSAHMLFLDEGDAAALQAEGWMLRHGVQFHWQADAEPADKPTPDWEGFLARLQRDKRKKIQQERRRVAEAGVVFRALQGPEISSAEWDFFHHCYTLTYQAHQSTPYLTRDFFARVAATMAPHWLLFVASREGRDLACSLVALEPERGVAYGRYWGATEYVPCLHFEACYYQPLAWCLAQGYRRFEGGAQGEHKMARGLLPVRTTSAHRLRDPRFAAAVQEFLAAEDAHIDGYVDELRERNPFKDAEPGG